VSRGDESGPELEPPARPARRRVLTLP
jgi:hypothetical protein